MIEPSVRGSRIVFALRQAGLLAVALLVAGLVAERLRPDSVTARDIASASYLWAIVLWLAVLLFNALAFERSQLSAIEQSPLFAALGVSAFVFVTGLISFDGDSLGEGLAYLFANAVGSAMFWWGLFGLGYLVVQRLRD